MAYTPLFQRRRFIASVTMSALVLTQFVTGVFPVPIAPIAASEATLFSGHGTGSSSSSSSTSNNPECSDGIDNDGDGKIDYNGRTCPTTPGVCKEVWLKSDGASFVAGCDGYIVQNFINDNLATVVERTEDGRREVVGICDDDMLPRLVGPQRTVADNICRNPGDNDSVVCSRDGTFQVQRHIDDFCGLIGDQKVQIKAGDKVTFYMEFSKHPPIGNVKFVPTGAPTNVNCTPADPDPECSGPDDDSEDPQGADLSITKTGPVSVLRGGTAVFNIKVTNNGPETATNVVIEDDRGTGMVFNAAKSSTECSLANNNITVVCDGFNLAKGQSKTVSIAFDLVGNALTCGTSITNTATVHSSTADSNPGNNTSNAVHTDIECAPVYECSDGQDNDGDNLIDANDPGCWSNPENPNSYNPTDDDESNATSRCQDGKDNDGDGKVDYPADPGCDSPEDNNEENGGGQCPVDGGVKVKITLNTVKNTGDANAVKSIILGNGQVVSSGQWFPITNLDGSYIIDNQMQLGKPQLAVQRRNGVIEVLGYGEFAQGLETVYGTIEIDKGSFTEFLNQSTAILSPVEHQGNYTFGSTFDNAVDDEVFFVPGSKTAHFFLHYNTSSDGFRLKYDVFTQECPAPKIDIKKTGPAVIHPNEEVTYTFTIKNEGTTAQQDIRIVDAPFVSNGMTLVPGKSDPSCALNGAKNTIICGLYTLQPGQSKVVTLTGKAPNYACNRGDISNKGDVQVNNKSVDWDMHTATVQCNNPQLTITKSGPATAKPGTEIVYTLTVKNTGDAISPHTKVRDYIPQYFSFVANKSDASCYLFDAGTVECGDLDLAPGATKSFKITFAIADQAKCDWVAINTSKTWSQNVDSVYSNEVHSTITCPAPNLAIEKTGPATVTAGGNITYNFVVRNTGAGVATDVITSDFYIDDQTNPIYNPPFSYVSASGANCTYNNGNVACSLGNMQPGAQVQYSLTFKAPANTYCNETIVNQADVAERNNNSVAWDKHMVKVKCPTADLEIEKTGPATVHAGDTVTYNFVVRNTGAGVATDVITSDFYIDDQTNPIYNPPFSYVSASGANCTYNNGNVACSLGNMQPGAEIRYSLTFSTPAHAHCDETIVNQADVAERNNNSVAWDKHMVKVECDAPNLSVTKTGPATVQPGNTISYTVKVTNSGPGDALETLVIDDFPTHQLAFVPAQSTTGCSVGASGDVECSTGTIASGETRTFTFVFTVKDSAICNSSIVNAADVHARDGYNAWATHTATVECPEPQADLSLTKSGAGSTKRGDTMLYTIVVANSGPDAAQNITVTDPIPTGLTFNPAQSSTECTAANGTVTCAIAALGAQAQKNLTLAFTVSAQAVCGGTLLNQASVSAQTKDPNSANNVSQTVSTTVQCPQATFSLSKTDNRTLVEAGETLTYYVTAQNTSTVDATNISIIDTLPTQVTFVSATDGGTLNGSQVTWNGLSIPAGGYKTVRVTVTVNANTVGGTVLTNNAHLGNVTAQDITTVKDSTPLVGCIEISKETISDNGSQIFPVPQFTFRLDGADTTVNDIYGNAKFSNVSVGTHTVTEIVPQGWEQVSVIPANGTVTVQAGTDCAEVYFANKATAVQQPTFTISKTDGKTTVKPGESLTYSITVTNTSSVNATGVSVTDFLPSGVNFVSANNSGTHSGSVVTWNNLSILAGTAVNLTVTVQVDASTSDGTTLLNIASVVNGPYTTDTTTVEDDQQLFGCIEIRKQAFNTSNNPITTVPQFTFKLDNNQSVVNDSDGDAIFTNVPVGVHVVSEIVPANWTQVSVSPTSGIVTVNPGTDCAVVEFKNRQTQVSGNATYSISKTDNRTTAEAGDILTYSITVTNTSSVDGTNATVIDVLPSDVDYLSSSNGGDENNGVVTWDDLDIDAGETITLTVQVRIDSNVEDGDVLINTATVTGGSTATDTTTIDGGEDEDFELTITDYPDPVDICYEDEIEYDIRITNRGNSDKEVDVVAFLDSDTTFLDATDGGEDVTDERVEWDNIEIDEDDTVTLRLAVRIDDRYVRDGDRIELRVHVEGVQETEITRIEEYDCGRPPVNGQVLLNIDKTADRTEAKPGSLVSYTVSIRNDGDREIRNAILEDSFATSQLQIEDAGTGYQYGGGIRWELGTLAPHTTTVVRYRARISSSLGHGQVVPNTATVSGEGISRSDTYQVLIVNRLPQTGIGGFGNSGSAFLTPSKNADPALPLATWLTVIFSGLGMGGMFGRKLFLF